MSEQSALKVSMRRWQMMADSLPWPLIWLVLYCDSVRSTALSVAGSVAGVLGLTNWIGFGFYIVSVLLTNSLVLLINANGTPSKYFISPSPPAKPLTSSKSPAATNKNVKVKTVRPSGLSVSIDSRSGSFSAQDVASFLVNGLTENAFSFILWWTFWFGIVHGKYLQSWLTSNRMTAQKEILTHTHT